MEKRLLTSDPLPPLFLAGLAWLSTIVTGLVRELLRTDPDRQMTASIVPETDQWARILYSNNPS